MLCTGGRDKLMEKTAFVLPVTVSEWCHPIPVCSPILTDHLKDIYALYKFTLFTSAYGKS